MLSEGHSEAPEKARRKKLAGQQYSPIFVSPMLSEPAETDLEPEIAET
jgi:hypothetical protein